jgi:hypothetical protein
MSKDGVGRIAACSNRLTRRIDHAYFYPELEPSPRYPLPVDRVDDVLGAASPAEAVRRLHEDPPTPPVRRCRGPQPGRPSWKRARVRGSTVPRFHVFLPV